MAVVDILQDKVLVLNKKFFPLRICTVESALYLLFKDRAVVMDPHWVSFTLDEYSKVYFLQLNRAVRTVKRVYIAPEVVRLTEQDIVLDKKICLTNQNIFLRDGNACGYCGSKDEKKLTVDHIIPKSRYKSLGLAHHTTWENCVACCYSCNNKKGSKTPEEAGMKLRVKPHRPTSTLRFKFSKGWKPSWNNYISYQPASYKGGKV